MVESGQAFLFLWNKVECCGINLGFDFHEKEKQWGLWDSTTSWEPLTPEDLEVLQVQQKKRGLKLEKDQANVNTWVSANAPHSFPLVPLQHPSGGTGRDTWSVSHMVLRGNKQTFVWSAIYLRFVSLGVVSQ